MRKSNQVLTGIVLLALLIPATLVATLIFKFKTGNFIIPADKELSYERAFTGINHVTLTGLGDLKIIPSDSLHATIDTYEYIVVRVDVKGDSLIIRGDTSWIERDSTAVLPENRERIVHLRSENDVVLYLPAHITALIEDCDLIFKPNNKISGNSLSMKVINSTVNDNDDESYMQPRAMQNLDISADKSVINLTFDWTFGNLRIDLKNESRFDAGESKQLGPLQLGMDSTSIIHLNGAQYKKIIQK